MPSGRRSPSARISGPGDAPDHPQSGRSGASPFAVRYSGGPVPDRLRPGPRETISRTGDRPVRRSRGPAHRPWSRTGPWRRHRRGACAPVRSPCTRDQDRQAGHDGGDSPRRWCGPGVGQQVRGDLPGHPEQERADRGPLREPACPRADRILAGQPGAQRVGRVRLDADRQSDGRVEMQGWPDSWQRGDPPEAGLFRDARTQPDHTSVAAGAARTSSRPGPDGPP